MTVAIDAMQFGGEIVKRTAFVVLQWGYRLVDALHSKQNVKLVSVEALEARTGWPASVGRLSANNKRGEAVK